MKTAKKLIQEKHAKSENTKNTAKMPIIIDKITVFCVFYLLKLKFNYSVLKASTGSLFAALLAGIRPEISVSTMLSATSKTACLGSRVAIFGTDARCITISLAI